MKDPIVEEVLKLRKSHAEKFNFNLHAICKDLKKNEKTCGHPLVSLPVKHLLKASSDRESLRKWGRAYAKKSGLKEEDIIEAVSRRRRPR